MKNKFTVLDKEILNILLSQFGNIDIISTNKNNNNIEIDFYNNLLCLNEINVEYYLTLKIKIN